MLLKLHLKELCIKIISAGKYEIIWPQENDETLAIYIPPKKRQQIIDDLRLIKQTYKNGISKNNKSVTVGSTSETLAKLIQTRKATGFKSLLLNCWNITQVL